jgi:hypothetical protein
MKPLRALGVFCAATTALLGQAPARGQLARELLAERPAEWRTIPSGEWQIHIRRGTAVETDAAAIARMVTEVRQHLISRLALSPAKAPAAQLFFVGSRDEIQRLTGRPLAGFVQPDEPTGVFTYLAGYRHESLLRHELTHLMTFQNWGQTRQGPWLIEGLAVWAAGGCQGHSSDALAAGVLARGGLVPLTRLASSFRELPEDVAMSQAGSLVGFLIERDGIARLKARWQGSAEVNHPLGSSGAAIEAAWIDRLRQITPATIDIPRVMKEGC